MTNSDAKCYISSLFQRLSWRTWGRCRRKARRRKARVKARRYRKQRYVTSFQWISPPLVLTVNREWFGVSCATQVSSGSRNSVEMGSGGGFRISQRGHQLQRWGYQPIIWPFFPKPEENERNWTMICQGMWPSVIPFLFSCSFRKKLCQIITG